MASRRRNVPDVPARRPRDNRGKSAYEWTFIVAGTSGSVPHRISSPQTFYPLVDILGTDVGFRISLNPESPSSVPSACRVGITSTVVVESIQPI